MGAGAMTLAELQVILTANIAQVLPQVMEVRKAFGTLSDSADQAGRDIDKTVTDTSSKTEKSLDSENKAEDKSAQATQKATQAKRQSLEEIAAIAQRAADRYSQSFSEMTGKPMEFPDNEPTGSGKSMTAILAERQRAQEAAQNAAQSAATAVDPSRMERIQAIAEHVRQTVAGMFGGISSGSAEAQASLEAMGARLDNINARADLQRMKLSELQAQYAKVAEQFGADSAQALKLQGQILGVESRLQSLAAQSDKAAAAMEALQASMTGTGNAAQSDRVATDEESSGHEAATQSAGGFEKALGRIQSQIFRNLVVYGLLIKGLSSLGSYMWDALKTNTAFSDSLNNLKVQFLTAFYPIYQAVLPALTSFINALAKAMAYIAAFIAGFFGTTYSAAEKGAAGLNKNVQALNDTSKSADKAKKSTDDLKKSLAGFDQINKLEKPSSDSAGAAGDTGASAETPTGIAGADFGAANAKPLISEDQIAAAEAAGQRVRAIVQGIWEFVEKYKTPIIVAIGAIVAAFLLFKVISGISAFIAAVTSSIGLVVLAILAVVAVVILLIHYWPEIQKGAESAWKGIQAAWNDTGKWFGARWADIQNAFKDTEKWFGQKFTDARNNVHTAWNDVGTWFGNRRSDIQNAYGDVHSWFGSKFQQAKENATGAWNDAGSRFGSIWGGIQGAFSNTGWIGSRFQDAYNSVVGTWDSLPDRFWNIWSSIGAGMRAFLNDIIYPLNRMISGINGIQFNVPNWVPVLGGDHFGINLNQIPYLAQGGIVSSATAFVAGEAGSEAVLPLQRNTGWMDTLAAKVASQVPQDASNLTVTMPVYLDGREIYQSTKKYALRDARGANAPAFT